jgi:glycosyltransferase involved in cell wall biosynthesis
VDLSRFHPASRAATPTVLYSGDLDEPRKHVTHLVDAVDLLGRDVPDVRVWLSGPGRSRSGRRVETLPLGTVEEQGERYARAWLTALPSAYEAFGLVVLESLASGTPVVVGDDAALPELVDAGRTGVLVRPGDVKALVAALAEGLQLARDPATADVCRAAAAHHDWETAVAPLYEAAYRGS